MVSKTTILAAICEEKALDIFKSIASAHLNTDILITQLKLTRRQYYSRMSTLTKAGLVKREKGKYLVTALGRVIYSAQTNLEAKIENAANNYWKLKSIDSLKISSTQERNEVISALIDNQEIKSILMKEEPHLSAQAVVKKAHVVQDPLLTLPKYP